MKPTLCKSRFAGGFVCGAAVSAAAFLFVANPAAQVRATAAQSAIEPQYFVTGDQFSATVWRLETAGTLTCISHNLCREPTIAPERIEPRDPAVPRGPRTPTGPSVPMPDRPDE